METTQPETTRPRIYVACLAAYNSGILHGAWIDAHQSEEEMRREIAAMLKASPIVGAEEYAIHDHEGFEDIQLEEYAGIERVAEIAALLTDYGSLAGAVLTHFGGDLDDATKALEDGYLGCFWTLGDFMQDMMEEGTPVPDIYRAYIDWDAMARDAELSDDVFTIQTAHDEVHVFAGS